MVSGFSIVLASVFVFLPAQAASFTTRPGTAPLFVSYPWSSVFALVTLLSLTLGSLFSPMTVCGLNDRI